MSNRDLNHNEVAILNAASTIFSGIVSTGEVNSSNEEKAINYALAVAAKMAKKIDSSGKFEISSLAENEVPWPW